MISQRCPKCLSKRIRRGYRPTPLWSKILFRYNLLCDNCNWEFVGFAVPGTVTSKPTRKPKKHVSKKDGSTGELTLETAGVGEPLPSLETPENGLAAETEKKKKSRAADRGKK